MVAEVDFNNSKTEFRYSRVKVAGIAFIAFVLAVVLLLLPIVLIFERPYDILTPGGIVFFLILAGGGLYVLLWGFNFFWITFEVSDQGLRYTSLFSKRTIPWKQIAGIKRFHFLGAHDRKDLASAPPDLALQTADDKKLYILNLMKEQDFDMLLSRIKEKTQWADQEKVWQRDVLKKQGIILKVAGVVMVVFGIFFPRMYEYLNNPGRHKDPDMKIVDLLVDILGVNGMAFLFVGFGIFLFFKKPQIKKLKKTDSA